MPKRGVIVKVNIRNKFFSISGRSTVTDVDGKDVFVVKGKTFSISRKKKIYSADGTLLYSVKNRVFNFLDKYAYIYGADGEKICRVREKYFAVRRDFFVENYKDEIHLEGEFFSLSSRIIKNGEPVGTITRRIDITDHFQLEANDDDLPFMVALVIAMDNIKDKKQN